MSSYEPKDIDFGEIKNVNRHSGATDCSLSCGDVVQSKSKGGVQLTRDPSDGSHDQKVVVVGVLRSGIIQEVQPYVITYSTWPDVVREDERVLNYSDLGDVEHVQYKVRDDSGVTGWVGGGAVVHREKLLNSRADMYDHWNEWGGK